MTERELLQRRVLLHRQAAILSRKFRRDYDRLFREDPLAANVFLLLSELADERGQITFTNPPEEEVQRLMLSRFEDPWAYQLPGGRP